MITSYRRLYIVGIALFAADLALFLGGCTSVPATRTILTEDRTELPTVKVNDFLLIEVRINDAGPFRLLVDTGTDGLVIAPDVARAAHLKILDEPAKLNGTNVKGVLIRSLVSGGMKLEDLPAVLVEPAPVALLRKAIPGYDGVIGMAPLKDVVLEMDFPGRRVSVTRPGSQSYPRAAAVSYSGLSPEVTMDIAGHSWRALVDTGSGYTLIVPRLDDLPLEYSPIRETGPGGINLTSSTGVRLGNSHLAGDAHLGPALWHNPAVHEEPGDGLANLGTGALGRWKLAFDQSTHLIYFLREESHPENHPAG